MKMMKGIQEFLYVFIIAVILLVAFYAVSFFYQGDSGPGGGVGEFTVIKELTTIGSVGFETEFAASAYSIGSFTVGETQSETLKTIPQMKISASLVGSEQEAFKIEVPEWYQDSLRDIKISFDVQDSSTYGNLKINWNGRTFYYDKPRRGESVSFLIDSEFVGDINNLEIMSEGPGFFFWASTTYIIRNFKVNVEYGPSKLYGFELSSQELEAFRRGVVEFSGSGSGLVIKVNSVSIYDETPSGSETVEFGFSYVPLNVGMNVLSFQAPSGTVNLQNTKLSVYLLGNEIVKKRKFNITQQELDGINLGQGRIDYTIDSINRDGRLRIKLNGNLLATPAPSVGTTTIHFTPVDTKLGENDIEISGTGSYEVSDILIGYE